MFPKEFLLRVYYKYVPASAKRKIPDSLRHYMKRWAGLSTDSEQFISPRSRHAVINQKELREFLDVTPRELNPSSREYRSSLNIHWVIPEFSPAGGGMRTIFLMCRYLEMFGHRCTIWINHPNSTRHPQGWLFDVTRHYKPFVAEMKPLDEKFFEAEGDILLATGWQTALAVAANPNFKERFYFVQDYESLFYPAGAMSLAAEQTYRLGLDCVCGSPWLSGIMSDKYGLWARHFYSAYDKDNYKAAPKSKKNEKPRICVYARFNSPRRGIELILLALELLARERQDFHVDFYGNPGPITEAPYSSTNHGILDEGQLSALYNACDIGICFSITNYGGVPKEMMASGLPILELDVESTRAVYPEDTVTFVAPTPPAIAEGIRRLLDDPEYKRRQTESAERWVRQFSWKGAARVIERTLLEKLELDGFQRKDLSAPALVTAAPKVSVIIPTLNGGELLQKVTAAVLGQVAPWEFELLIIDSGSTDGSIETLEDNRDITFVHIDKSEFNHGGTRNLGASKSRGEFLVFLTQDALPVGDGWLFDIVSSMTRSPEVAGVFGRHRPYEDATIFVKRDLERTFETFDEIHPIVWDPEHKGAYWHRYKKLQRNGRLFFSNNNSCLRRSVWEKIPFRQISFGEDQMWANDIDARGLVKLYSPHACVYHSHNYSPESAYNREHLASAWRIKYKNQTDITSEAEMLRRTEEKNRNDIDFAQKNGVPEEELRQQLAINEAVFKARLAAYQESRENTEFYREL